MIYQNYSQSKGNRFQKRTHILHMHSDIPCLIQNCFLCDSQEIPLFQANSHIYIVEQEVLKNHLYILSCCSAFKNLIIPQHYIQNINKESEILLQSLLDNIDKQIYVFPTLFAKQIFKPLTTTIEDQQREMDQQLINFYTHHGSLNIKLLNIQCFFNIIKNESSQFGDFLGIQDFDDTIEYFKEYESIEKIIQGVKEGIYIEGRFWNNKVMTKMGFDVICDAARVMSGDRVAIRLIEGDWKKNIKGGLQDPDENENFQNNESTFLKLAQEIQAIQNDKMRSIVQNIIQNGLSPKGEIMGIIKRQERQFCGHLEITNPEENQNIQKVYKFIPVDNRYPSFWVQTQNPKELYNQKIMIKFDKWPIYSELPFGIYVSTIGEIGNMDTEQRVILLEHQVEFRPFSKQVLECLPQDNYQIPQEEILKRTDLRHIPICSVDPPGCKDIDDALHCIRLKNGNYEVGVHIADVSHFVKPETAIDREASSRCTTVDRRTDMLPKLLTETLCSLRDDGDRLAFSCLFEINNEAKVVNTKFCKSVIRSKKSMTYQMAQEMIDNTKDNSQLALSLRDLLNLALQLKNARNDNGALTLASTQVKFTFDQETHNPTDVAFYHSYSTNYMVEEFMLLANIHVAEQIHLHYPASAILRRHTQPKPKQIKDLQKLLANLGFDFQYDTSKQLQESLDQVKRKDDQFFNKLVRILTTRTMNEATYFCTADFDFPEFNHYGLACNLYTHFTSPIRRYADVLVHRQKFQIRLLAASIDVESLPNNMTSPPQLTKQCYQLNLKNRNARNASRASSDYHQYLFFQQNPVQSTGYITSIESNEITILLEKYGLEGKVQLDSEGKEIQGVPCIQHRDKNLYVFDRVEVSVKVTLSGFKKIIHMEIL